MKPDVAHGARRYPRLPVPRLRATKRLPGRKPLRATTQSSPAAGRVRDRIVNLSDGVFAIAITLLVLDITVPDIPENLVASELPEELLLLWPRYLGYFLSFVGIAVFWIIHHPIFRPI